MAQMYLSDESINKMPYSLEAEQSVLGTIILDPDKIRLRMRYARRTFILNSTSTYTKLCAICFLQTAQ